MIIGNKPILHRVGGNCIDTKGYYKYEVNFDVEILKPTISIYGKLDFNDHRAFNPKMTATIKREKYEMQHVRHIAFRAGFGSKIKYESVSFEPVLVEACEMFLILNEKELHMLEKYYRNATHGGCITKDILTDSLLEVGLHGFKEFCLVENYYVVRDGKKVYMN